MSDVTRTPFSRSKGQGHQAALLSTALTRNIRRLQRSAWERIRRAKVLLRCICSAARDGGGEGRGILCRHAHSLFI